MLESFHSRKDDVIGALQDLVGFAEKIGARSLAGRIDADLVKKLEADRFHLVVVGEFNHGKTTFVNALLGAGLRDRIRVIASGKILTGFHMMRALALGADLCASARGMMFALGIVDKLTPDAMTGGEIIAGTGTIDIYKPSTSAMNASVCSFTSSVTALLRLGVTST